VYEHLRNSPVYQTALRAPSAFALYPANWMKKKHLWPDHRVQTAAIRLDHLMTNALDPHYSYICPDHVSAMMTFLECFGRDLPRWNLSAQARSMIEPRIAFCRQIIAQRQEDCSARGEEPPSSALFRETIIRNEGDIDEVVYDNPCYNYYHMSFFRPPLYYKLGYYWGDPI
jgi:hypothetical protein